MKLPTLAPPLRRWPLLAIAGALLAMVSLLLVPGAASASVTIAGASAPSYAEHGTDIVATYTASDPGNDGVEWSISGTAAGRFSINRSGELSFNEPPDFEKRADADRNNKYVLTVVATAGDQSGSLEVTVTVTDGNDPPYILEGVPPL